VLGWVRGGSGRLLLLGLLRVLPLLGIVVRGLPGSLGGRFTVGAELEVGLSAAALEGPCDVLPVVAKATVNFLVDHQWWFGHFWCKHTPRSRVQKRCSTLLRLFAHPR